MGAMRYGKLADEQPYTRTGICCGKACMKNTERMGKPDVLLYRLREYVYRCRRCFKREAGYYP